MSSNEKINELQRLSDEATPGPWGIGNGDTIATEVEQISRGGFRCHHVIVRFDDQDYDEEWAEPREVGDMETDAALIVAMRNALPDLLAELRQLRAEGSS